MRKADEKIVYQANKKKYFKKESTINDKYILEAMNFAYKMAYTAEGFHRVSRSGGNKERKKGEIFVDTFNGKLGEFAVYQYFLSSGIELSYPDLKVMGEGEWDTYDYVYKEFKIGVKTTKSYSNFLLLEVNDWDNEGLYKPNIPKGAAHYSAILLVRVDTSALDIVKGLNLLNNEIPKSIYDLKDKLTTKQYYYDIPGVTNMELLKNAISNKQIIKQNNYLQTTGTQMDADNYYIQSGDLLDLKYLINRLKSL